MAKQKQEKFTDELTITDVMDEVIEKLENAAALLISARNIQDKTGQSTSRIVSASMKVNEVIQTLKPYIEG